MTLDPINNSSVGDNFQIRVENFFISKNPSPADPLPQINVLPPFLTPALEIITSAGETISNKLDSLYLTIKKETKFIFEHPPTIEEIRIETELTFKKAAEDLARGDARCALIRYLNIKEKLLDYQAYEGGKAKLAEVYLKIEDIYFQIVQDAASNGKEDRAGRFLRKAHILCEKAVKMSLEGKSSILQGEAYSNLGDIFLKFAEINTGKPVKELTYCLKAKEAYENSLFIWPIDNKIERKIAFVNYKIANFYSHGKGPTSDNQATAVKELSPGVNMVHNYITIHVSQEAKLKNILDENFPSLALNEVVYNTILGLNTLDTTEGGETLIPVGDLKIPAFMLREKERKAIAEKTAPQEDKEIPAENKDLPKENKFEIDNALDRLAPDQVGAEPPAPALIPIESEVNIDGNKIELIPTPAHIIESKIPTVEDNTNSSSSVKQLHFIGTIKGKEEIFLKNRVYTWLGENLHACTKPGSSQNLLPPDPERKLVKGIEPFTINLFVDPNTTLLPLFTATYYDIDPEDIFFFDSEKKPVKVNYILKRDATGSVKIEIKDANFSGWVAYGLYLSAPLKPEPPSTEFLATYTNLEYKIDYPLDLSQELDSWEGLSAKEIADNLLQWIQENIKGDNSSEAANAWEEFYKNPTEPTVNFLLKYRKGDCDLCNGLFVAILRDRYKIPARLAAGYKVSDNQKYLWTNPGHTQSEVWIENEWYQYDASPFTVDPQAYEKRQVVETDSKKEEKTSDTITQYKIDYAKKREKYLKMFFSHQNLRDYTYRDSLFPKYAAYQTEILQLLTPRNAYHTDSVYVFKPGIKPDKIEEIIGNKNQELLKDLKRVYSYYSNTLGLSASMLIEVYKNDISREEKESYIQDFLTLAQLDRENLKLHLDVLSEAWWGEDFKKDFLVFLRELHKTGKITSKDYFNYGYDLAEELDKLKEFAASLPREFLLKKKILQLDPTDPDKVRLIINDKLFALVKLKGDKELMAAKFSEIMRMKGRSNLYLDQKEVAELAIASKNQNCISQALEGQIEKLYSSDVISNLANEKDEWVFSDPPHTGILVKHMNVLIKTIYACENEPLAERGINEFFKDLKNTLAKIPTKTIGIDYTEFMLEETIITLYDLRDSLTPFLAKSFVEKIISFYQQAQLPTPVDLKFLTLCLATKDAKLIENQFKIEDLLKLAIIINSYEDCSPIGILGHYFSEHSPQEPFYQVLLKLAFRIQSAYYAIDSLLPGEKNADPDLNNWRIRDGSVLMETVPTHQALELFSSEKDNKSQTRAGIYFFISKMQAILSRLTLNDPNLNFDLIEDIYKPLAFVQKAALENNSLNLEKDYKKKLALELLKIMTGLIEQDLLLKNEELLRYFSANIAKLMQESMSQEEITNLAFTLAEKYCQSPKNTPGEIVWQTILNALLPTLSPINHPTFIKKFFDLGSVNMCGGKIMPIYDALTFLLDGLYEEEEKKAMLDFFLLNYDQFSLAQKLLISSRFLKNEARNSPTAATLITKLENQPGLSNINIPKAELDEAAVNFTFYANNKSFYSSTGKKMELNRISFDQSFADFIKNYFGIKLYDASNSNLPSF